MPAFLLTIREGLEAVLIITILLSTLRRLGRQELARFVWLGVGLAALCSIIVAGALSVAGVELEGRAEQIYEGVTLLVAALVLTGMLVWMRSSGPSVGRRLSAAVQQAADTQQSAPIQQTAFPGAAQQSSGRRPMAQGTAGEPAAQSGMGVFGVAFMAVAREGFELALLLAATALAASPANTAVGGALGLAVTAGVGVLLYRGALHLNFARFFQASSLVLVLFAAGMASLATHEFVEAGLVPGLIDPVWNLGRVLSDQSTAGELFRALFGYTSAPALTQVLVYLAYLGAAGWLLWPRPAHAPAAAH